MAAFCLKDRNFSKHRRAGILQCALFFEKLSEKKMKHIRLFCPSIFFYFFLLYGCGLYTASLYPQVVYGAENTPSLAGVPAVPDFTVAAVQVAVANIRIKPSIDSAILIKLKKGDPVAIIGRQGSWLAVKLPDNRLGWVHENLLLKSQTSSIDTAAGKLISAIQSDIISKNKEKVIFKLSGNYPPETFVVNIEQPKVVCDFAGLLIGSGVGRVIKVNGTLIEQIRVAYHEKPSAKVRVVVDLVPDRKYKIEQTFYREEHIFELAIQPEP